MIKAFGKYITVKKMNSDKEFDTGLVVKHSQANLIVKAEVLSVGTDESFFEDEARKKPILKKGDTVYVHEFPKDTQIDEDGEDVTFILASTIYGYNTK